MVTVAPPLLSVRPHFIWQSCPPIPTQAQTATSRSVHMRHAKGCRACCSKISPRDRSTFMARKLANAVVLRRQGAFVFSHEDPLRARREKLRAAASPGKEIDTNARNKEPFILDRVLEVLTRLYPVYVILGGFLALKKPETFAWFVSRGPGSYSMALGAIMLVMGLTLRVEDLTGVILHRPKAVIFGFAAQYAIMPAMGLLASHLFWLSPELSAGLILVSCCPGGTASNVVVVVPVLLGTWLQSAQPQAVARVSRFSPLVAVLISSVLACSVFSANIPLLLEASGGLAGGPSGSQLGALVAGVLFVHSTGFFIGYLAAWLVGFSEPQRRAVSIEVGMQNSSLGVVLATQHFASPLAPIPAALSAVLMNIMGSGLALLWRQFGSPAEEFPSPPAPELLAPVGGKELKN
eukprot:jgi/Mesen1/8660/ME000504S08101